MERKSFPINSVVFREGDPGESLFVIREGLVGVFTGYGTPQEVKLAELSPGKTVGEMALLDSAPRSATVVALEQTEADEIHRDDMEQFFRENPEHMVEMLRHFSGRLRDMTSRYLDACGTIAEMERGGKRPAGLLAKIKAFIADYDEGQRTAAAGMLTSYPFY